jgi:hypothetical protein
MLSEISVNFTHNSRGHISNDGSLLQSKCDGNVGGVRQ